MLIAANYAPSRVKLPRIYDKKDINRFLLGKEFHCALRRNSSRLRLSIARKAEQIVRFPFIFTIIYRIKPYCKFFLLKKFPRCHSERSEAQSRNLLKTVIARNVITKQSRFFRFFRSLLPIFTCAETLFKANMVCTVTYIDTGERKSEKSRIFL